MFEKLFQDYFFVKNKLNFSLKNLINEPNKSSHPNYELNFLKFGTSI